MWTAFTRAQAMWSASSMEPALPALRDDRAPFWCEFAGLAPLSVGVAECVIVLKEALKTFDSCLLTDSVTSWLCGLNLWSVVLFLANSSLSSSLLLEENISSLFSGFSSGLPRYMETIPLDSEFWLLFICSFFFFFLNLIFFTQQNAQ